MSRNAARTLIAAPYVGEFGWELMNWQGRIRKLARQHANSHIIVCAQPDRRPLYDWPEIEDRLTFCPISVSDIPGHPNDDHRVNSAGEPLGPDALHSMLSQLVKKTCTQMGICTVNAHILMPAFRSKLWPTHKRWQYFAPLGTRLQPSVDVVLVPRSRALAPQRNQSPAWWNELAAALARENLRVDFYPSGPNTLSQAITLLSQARLAVGASTGGLHLASLCRCPHFVWGSGSNQRWTTYGMTNRQRYETIWNPLGTPCIYDECGWQPSVAHVRDQALAALELIGRRESAGNTWSWNASWRMRRAFGRLIQIHAAFPSMPWRLRYLVREHLV